ncbi:MAG: cupin domain-containing protein [Gammaproteobacteria bacterium]|nr:cupin domain-containing protein [Gammaproteobacteria bacterium]
MSDRPPMLNLNEIALDDFGHGEKFAARLGRVGGTLGMQKIGCGLVVLEPGKRAWPFHGHYAQEEAFVILEGQGVIRYGDGEHRVTSGDVVFTPPGPDRAHQIVNDSDHPLKYLALSSMDSPDICYYPDSNKTGAFHVTDGGFVGFMTRDGELADYWEGED